MILYYTGTGNSEYVARRIESEIKDDCLNLFERLRNEDTSELYSGKPWIIVVPTYAWRIPKIVENWLLKTSLKGNSDIYFVMTCGNSNGNADAYLQKLCKRKKLNYMGCQSIVMPENYIAMFTAPDSNKALQIIEQADKVIDQTIEVIRKNQHISKSHISLLDRINSGIINDLFYPLFVHAKKFKTTDVCVSCGKCVDVCPLNNIVLMNNKPVWNNTCTHCMACICKCPTEAIEYGTISKNKVRYTCPK